MATTVTVGPDAALDALRTQKKMNDIKVEDMMTHPRRHPPATRHDSRGRAAIVE